MSHVPDDAFDRDLRRIHADALEALSPRMQAQLAQRRRAALAGSTARAPRPHLAWAAAGASALALVVALQVRPPAGTSLDAVPRTVTAVPEAATDADGLFAEHPDFYLWLASGEAQAYAVE